MKAIVYVLIGVAVTLTVLGGLSDITGKKFFLSKQHLWNDGLFLLVLIQTFMVLHKNN